MPALAMRRQPLHGGPRHGGDRLGVAGDHGARGLAVGDERQRRGEGRVGGRAQAVGRVRAVLVREHQLEQRRVAGGEAHVGPGQGGQAGVEVGPAASIAVAQRAAEALEAVLRQGVEQRLLVGEVAAGRGVADPGLAREVAQRELREAALAQRALGARQQLGAQVAVVVGAGGGDGHADRS